MLMVRASVSGVRKGGRQVDFAIELGDWGWFMLIVGALVFGVVAQVIGETRSGFEWLVAPLALSRRAERCFRIGSGVPHL
jgi:hypothetical protein